MFKRDMRRMLILAAAAAVAGAPTAQAAVVCVPVTGPGCDSSAATPQLAADAAAEGDTVRIAAGEFPGVATDKRLTFVGAGSGTVASAAGATILTGTAATPDALRLNHGGIVRALRALGAPGSATNVAGSGIRVFVEDPTNHDLELEDVIAQGGAAGDEWGGGSGVELVHLSGGGGAVVPAVAVRGGAILAGDGDAPVGIPPAPGEPPYYRQPQPALSLNGRLFEASITGTLIQGGLRRLPGARGDAVYIYGGHLVLDRVTASGGTALRISHATTRTDHSTLAGQVAGLEVRPNGPMMMGPTEIVDSVVTAVPVAGQSGQAAAAVYATAGTSRVVARGSTFFARGAVAAAYRQSPEYDVRGPVVSTLRNTLVLALSSSPGAADLVAATGSVDAAFSAYRTRRLTNGATAPTPGAGSNIAASPLVDRALLPLPGSPLIDSGDAALVAAGERDRAGTPRSVDGDGDCVARPDIGAFERPAVACRPNRRPVVTRFGVTPRRFAPERRRRARPASASRRVRRGTRFRFRLSEPARVSISLRRVRRGPDRRVGVIRRRAAAGATSVRFAGRPRGRPLPRGLYVARIVARDRSGARSRPRSATFRIVRPGLRRRGG